MRFAAVASATLALAIAATLFDPTPADARRSMGARVMRAPSAPRRVFRAPAMKRATLSRAPKLKLERRTVLTATKKKTIVPLVKKKSTTLPLVKKRELKKPLIKKDIVKTPLIKKKDIAKTPVFKKKDVVKAPLIKAGPDVGFKKTKLGSHVKFGKAKLGKMPVTKAVSGTRMLSARLALPPKITPKVSLIKAPQPQFQSRMAPFVQRHWKKAFVWVAVAGIGYMTIPEIYYDRFLGYVAGDEPDYDGCIKLLSQAALEEEEEIVRIRHPKPVTAPYRFTAKVAPEQVKQEVKQDGPTCTFDPFIERNWSRPFVWVQIPSVGNVTVPEEFYDRFVGFAGAEPPNYQAACAVLVEASAADTVVATSEDFMRPEFR